MKILLSYYLKKKINNLFHSQKQKIIKRSLPSKTINRDEKIVLILLKLKKKKKKTIMENELKRSVQFCGSISIQLV